MRVHYVLNHGGTPEGKLADVELHFEEGVLAGLRLVGCSMWRGKKGESPSVLVPSRSYATAGGVRYYELLRPAVEGSGVEEDASTEAKQAARRFKEFLKDEYLRIVGEAGEGAEGAEKKRRRKGAEGKVEKAENLTS